MYFDAAADTGLTGTGGSAFGNNGGDPSTVFAAARATTVSAGTFLTSGASIFTRLLSRSASSPSLGCLRTPASFFSLDGEGEVEREEEGDEDDDDDEEEEDDEDEDEDEEEESDEREDSLSFELLFAFPMNVRAFLAAGQYGHEAHSSTFSAL